MKKRIISMVLVIIMCLSLVPNISFADTNTVTLDVNPSPKVEVALSVGDTKVDYSTFEKDLKISLKGKGIDDNNIEISAVEAQSSNTSNKFQWWTYDHTVNNGVQTIDNTNHIYVEKITSGETNTQNTNNSKDRHIVTTNNGATMDLYGYGMSGYKDFNFLPNAQSTKKVVEFTVEEKSAYDALDGVGFLINSSITGTYPSAQFINGYLLFFQYNGGGLGSSIKLFKLVNVNTYTLHHISTSATFDGSSITGASLLGTATYSTNKYKKFKIEVLPNSVRLWFVAGTDNTIFNTTLSDSNLVTWNSGNKFYPLTPEYDTVGSSSVFRGGYGPLISYRSHSCARLTYFQLSNLTMTQDYVRSLTEIIREPNWHDDSNSFLVNLNEFAIEDFSKEYTTAEIINRLSDEDITYIGWCGSKNVEASQIFTTKLGGGALVNIDDLATNTYEKQIAAIADAIVKEVNAKKSANKNTFLVTDQFSFTTIGATLNDGEWRVGYSASGYGVNETIDAYADLATVSFTAPGYYRIYHGDSSTFIEQIRIHESPVSAFTLSSSLSGITVANKSYDPEFCSDISSATGSLINGIKTSTFEYMNLKEASPSWITTAPATLTATDVWLVRLTVNDDDGATATMVKQISLGSTGTVAVPYNSFILSETTLVKGIAASVSVDIIDQSYSLNGTDTVTANYTVKDSNGNVKTTFTLNSGEIKNLVVTDYTGGTYTVSMNATATSGSNTSETSPTVSRTFKVVNGYVVSYEANGGSGAPSNQVKIDNQILTLASTAPTRSGFVFKHWTDSSNNKYIPGASYAGNAALNLTAQWMTIPTLTLSDKNVVYNGNTLSIDAATVTGVTVNEVSYSYYSDINCTLAASPVNVGIYYVRASVIATEDHAAAYSNLATLTITPATISIDVSDKTTGYTCSNIEIDAATISGISSSFITTNIIYTYYTDASCTTLTTAGNSGALNIGGAPKTAGKYYVKATIAASDNYKAATTAAPATLIITAAIDGSLSIGSNRTSDYGDPSFQISATGGNGTGIVTFTSSNPTAASVTAAGYVTINAVGTTTITATKASDGNYTAQTAFITITVNKKPVTYTITNNKKIYTGSAQYASVIPNVSTLVGGSDYIVVYKNSDNSIVDNPIEKGNYSISVTTTNSNYVGSAEGTLGTLIISDANQISALEIGGLPNYIEYDDSFALYANGGNGNGGITWKSSDTGVATIDSNGNVKIAKTGRATITVTKAEDGNYKKQTAEATIIAVKKKVAYDITNTQYTFDNSSKSVTVTPSIAGFAGYTVTGNGQTDAGTYNITVTTDDLNYQGSATAKLVINKANLNVSISQEDGIYATEIADPVVTETEDYTSVEITYEGYKIANEINSKPINAGNYTVIARFEGDKNHNYAIAKCNFVIAKKALTVTTDNQTRKYMEENPVLTLTYDGFAIGDNESDLYIAPQVKTAATRDSVVGKYDIIASSGIDTNYEFKYVNTGKLTIVQISQNISLYITNVPNTTTYGDAFVLYANGGNGDGGITWNSSDISVGTIDNYGNVNIVGVGDVKFTAVKEADANFSEQSESVTIKAAKKPITYVITKTQYTYDGVAKSITVIPSISGFDNYTVTGNGQTDAGTYYITVTTNDPNYQGSASSELIINKADSTASVVQENITYGTEVNPTFGYSNGSCMVTYMGNSIPGETEVKPVNAGTYTIIVRVTGDVNHNDSIATDTFIIGKKLLTITADDKTKNYNEENPNFTLNYDGFAYEDDESIIYIKPTATTVATKTSEAGDYNIVPRGGVDTNYDFNYVIGTLKILGIGQSTSLYITNAPSRESSLYGDKFTLYANGGDGTGNITWTSSDNTIATINSAGSVEIVGIGTVIFTATKAADINFEEQTETVTITAYPKVITVTAIAIDRLYDAESKTVKVTLNTGVTDVTASYTSATVLTANAGIGKEVTVTGISLDNPNYKPANTIIYTTVSIGMIPVEDDLVISGLPSSVTYGDDNFKLIATSQGTGKVGWSSNNSSVAKINSSTGVVTINGAGSAEITANKQSDGNYDAVSNSITIEVGKKAVTYSIINNTKIYNKAAQYAVITPSAISLREDIDYKVTYSQDGEKVDEPVLAGVYDINVVTLNNNYDGDSVGAKLTILAADQKSALEIGGLPNYIEYEDSFALYANGGNGEGNVTWAVESGNVYADVTSGSGIVSIKGVGTVTVSATKQGDGNYKDQIAKVTFTANKKQISVAISKTATTYNGDVQDVTVTGTATTIHPLKKITTVSYLMQTDSSQTDFRNIGTYNVSVDIDEDYTDLYVLNNRYNAVATITKARLIITAENKTKTYGDANPVFTLNYKLLGTDEENVFNKPIITCTADETTAVGEYDIILTDGQDNSNYNIVLVNGKLNITTAQLTVIADDKNVNYGKNAPTFTYSFSGFKGNDSISVLEGSVIFNCGYVRGSVEGEYDINISGFTSNNYNIDYVLGKLTVLPQPSSGGSGGGASIPQNTTTEEEVISPLLFDDVNENDWFYEAVRYVEKAALMSGTSSSAFEPNLETTRSMIVTILYRMEKQPSVTDASSFNDVTKDTWYHDAVVWGAENGIVKGYDSETFGPDDKITREQLTAILYRYVTYKGYMMKELSDLSMYNDLVEISSWAVDSMKWAVSEGIVTGTTLTTLEPKGYATRAQTAACLMRFIQNVTQ